jgi:hypothetical protein
VQPVPHLQCDRRSFASPTPVRIVALKRPRQTMPAAVRRAILERGLMEAYRARPPYQRNDYLAWIKRAVREPTKEKRLAQMLDELASGDRYMGMAYAARPAAEWHCGRCGRAFRVRNARHSCVSQTPAALFREHPRALAVVRAVERALTKVGPVEVEATKTQVAFRAERRFAYVWVPQMVLGRGSPDESVLTFDLPRRIGSPRVKEVVEVRPGLWTHHVPVASAREVDAEARAWLSEAYETRGLG